MQLKLSRAIYVTFDDVKRIEWPRSRQQTVRRYAALYYGFMLTCVGPRSDACDSAAASWPSVQDQHLHYLDAQYVHLHAAEHTAPAVGSAYPTQVHHQRRDHAARL